MDAPKTRSLSFQSVALAAAAAVAQLLVALIFVLAARGTDPESLGRVVSMIAIGVTLAGIIDFGSNARITRDIARGDQSHQSISRQLMTKILIYSSICILLGLLFGILFDGSEIWPCAILAFATITGQTLQSPIRGLRRAHIVGIVMLIDRICVLIVFTCLTFSGVDSASSLWISLSIGPIVAAIYSFVSTPKELRPSLRQWHAMNPWVRSVNFGASNIFISLQGLDVTLLKFFGGATAAGLYGAVSKWTQPISIVAGAFASASAPFVAHAGNMKDAWQSMRRAVWMPASAVLIAILIAISAPVLVPILIGDSYVGSGHVLTVLALAAIPAVVNQTFFVTLQNLGRDRAAAVILAVIIVVQLLIIVLFGAVYGAMACAIASLVSQILQVIGFSYLVRTELKKPRTTLTMTEQMKIES
ncbi:lipopolysaccharide biosynthesis protein [Arthrobacter sp. A2-55]|uniref:lipopolysaccharide biosynthesis protein n=1 Tax=Arthrobacter sp. A2-55 TaxID=2897337 RepID=UPI0021CD9150|nr:oligosaccharide flippase family protein [Arthrobacter sp. A2-55]MCU6479907.1 oligosaccharide flippase family protein [Arthrobacter sp. A2-55]